MSGLDHYAVMGNPVGHSRSPFIHAAFAEETGQALTYTALLVEQDAFPSAVHRFRASGGKGLSITIPFKASAYDLAEVRTDRAVQAQAVNTLHVLPNGTLLGDNTDGVGLLRDLTDNLGAVLAGIRVLVLGAGGATRGILHPLLSAEPRLVFIANRTPIRARELANRFADVGTVRSGGFEDLIGESFDLVINATSASLQEEILPLPDTHSQKAHGATTSCTPLPPPLSCGGPVSMVRPERPMVWGCWSSRQPRPFFYGVAYDPRLPLSSIVSERTSREKRSMVYRSTVTSRRALETVMIKPANTSNRDINIRIKKAGVPAARITRNSAKNPKSTRNDRECSMMVVTPALVDFINSINIATIPKISNTSDHVGSHVAPEGSEK